MSSGYLIFDPTIFLAKTNECPNGEVPPPNYSYTDELADGIFYSIPSGNRYSHIVALSTCFQEGSSLLKLDSPTELERYRVIGGKMNLSFIDKVQGDRQGHTQLELSQT